MRFDAIALVRSAQRETARMFGRTARIDTPDRHVLEDVILPFYARRSSMQRVLFVGCAPFTAHYGALFADRDYRTLDPVPRRRRFGSTKHIVGRLEELDRRMDPGSLDLIICNGVLGWGLDDAASAERAFAACYVTLAPAGELVIGWNNVSGRNAVAPEQINTLQAFERVCFEPLECSRYEVAGRSRHTYEFFRKPGDSRTDADSYAASV